jgi:hypothetical protein
LEEGEITTDGEEDDEEGSKTSLKYKYKVGYLSIFTAFIFLSNLGGRSRMFLAT